MFQGTPGVSVEWPAVLYPAPLPQYEAPSAIKTADTPKPSESSKDGVVQGKPSGVGNMMFLVYFVWCINKTT